LFTIALTALLLLLVLVLLLLVLVLLALLLALLLVLLLLLLLPGLSSPNDNSDFGALLPLNVGERRRRLSRALSRYKAEAPAASLFLCPALSARHGSSESSKEGVVSLCTACFTRDELKERRRDEKMRRRRNLTSNLLCCFQRGDWLMELDSILIVKKQ
jgi:hypothetical protein